MAVVERGELITYVLVSGDELVLAASDVFAFDDTRMNLVTNHRLVLAQEGAAWIRGWYSRETPEGRALLAAATMLRETSLPPGSPFGGSMSGGSGLPYAGSGVLLSHGGTLAVSMGAGYPNSWGNAPYTPYAMGPAQAPTPTLPNIVMVGSTK